MTNNWVKVYDLAEDQETIALVQKASLQTKDFGLIPEIALFGSEEWFAAVEDGRIPRHTILGVISRVYMTGHGDWPQFEIQSGEQKSQWTRHGEQEAYKVGRNIRLDYVMQRPKRPLLSRAEIEQVLEIFIEKIEYQFSKG